MWSDTLLSHCTLNLITIPALEVLEKQEQKELILEKPSDFEEESFIGESKGEKYSDIVKKTRADMAQTHGPPL